MSLSASSPWLVYTPRMRVRSLCDDDRAEAVRVHEVSEPLHRPWSPIMPEGQTFADLVETQIVKSNAGRASGDEYRLVGYLPDGRIAGFFNLFRIARGVFQNAYASWAVNAEVAGQGYATEGVGALLDFAFAPNPVGLELPRVQANVIPTNLASNRVAQKNDFRLEGLARRYLC